MIRSGTINMIHEGSQKGKSAYAISKELGISKNTAKKYMNQPKAEHGLKGRTKSSKLDPFKPQINEMIENGIFNCVVIFERLKDMGYTGDITKQYLFDSEIVNKLDLVFKYLLEEVYEIEIKRNKLVTKLKDVRNQI
jgi:predicted transcriptional regulator